MVATPAEAAGFVQVARLQGLDRVGVVVAVPAAALRAADLLAEVDMVSVAIDELAQLTFAADPGLPELADLLDPWQPALLELLAGVARAGRSAGRPVSMCVGDAGDPLLAIVLAGLGATSLSMAPRGVARGPRRPGGAQPRRVPRAGRAGAGRPPPRRRPAPRWPTPPGRARP